MFSDGSHVFIQGMRVQHIQQSDAEKVSLRHIYQFLKHSKYVFLDVTLTRVYKLSILLKTLQLFCSVRCPKKNK